MVLNIVQKSGYSVIDYISHKMFTSLKSKVTSFSASTFQLIADFLFTIQNSISSRKLHQLYAMFLFSFCLRFSSRVTVNSNL